MKRIGKMVTIILLIVVISGILLPTALADSPSSWAVNQVLTAIGANLVPEYMQTDFARATTRAEFCALGVVLYETVRGEITGRVSFVDTNDVNVEKMAFLGVVSGVGNNRFAPNDNLTREQAAVLLSNLVDELDKPFPVGSPNSADSALISSWATDGVGAVQAAGIMSSTGNNMFSPQSPYERQQSMITMLRVYEWVTGLAVPEVTLNSLRPSQSLTRGMTGAEFDRAYTIAYDIVWRYAGLPRQQQIEAVMTELAYIRHNSPWDYSMSERHYNDIYGFFVLNMTSCAGDVRAAGICLTILGIPYEHVNENQYTHQWVRVELDGRFVVLDVNAPFLGYESDPYRHPLIG